MFAEKYPPTIWDEYYDIYRKTDDGRQRDFIRGLVNIPGPSKSLSPYTIWTSLHISHTRFHDERNQSASRELIFTPGLFGVLYARYPVTRLRLEKDMYSKEYYLSTSLMMRSLTGTLALDLYTLKDDVMALHNDPNTQTLVDLCELPDENNHYWFSVRTTHPPWKLVLVYSHDSPKDPDFGVTPPNMVQSVFVGPLRLQ